MRQNDQEVLIQELLSIARLAGDADMVVYSCGTSDVQLKEYDSPVTQADLASHRAFASRLKPLLSKYPVVSEDAAGSLVHLRSHGRFWLINPVDGTKEFIARNGELKVNFALIKDGRCVRGVVYTPVIDALYWGVAGLGASRNMDGQTAAIKVAVSNTGRSSRMVASKSHLSEATQSLIDRSGEVSLVHSGSLRSFCRVAEGEADIYPRLTSTREWDLAAVQAVLEGAGGVVADLWGMPFLCRKPDVLTPSFMATRDTVLVTP